MHRDSGGTYGARRITAELCDEGGPVVNDKRVARIMRTVGRLPVGTRPPSRISAAKAPDLIGRDFAAAAANTKYVGDITYLPVSDRRPLCLEGRHRPRLRRPDGQPPIPCGQSSSPMP
ncbi:IS3 family transposase [Streptomyces sp. NPDC056401]|uniref:IS3 family transposase n=1 Tax=Streptomyces sp. NPDC056401 TaxID=3345809 RepID=UPI0035E09A9A